MKMREGIGFPSTCKTIDIYRRPLVLHDTNGFYKLLGLTPDASDKEIRRVGRKLLSKYHPDGTEPDEEKFLWLQEAYDVLTERRDEYDSLPAGHVIVTESMRNYSEIAPVDTPTKYSGWNYFSEVPRVTDDSVALWAYEQYLCDALAVPTTMPRISVVLIQGRGNPWVEDGLIYVPVSDVEGMVNTTPGADPEAQRQG